MEQTFPEKPAAIGQADIRPATTSSHDYDYAPSSRTLPPNTATQTPNPALLYESSGDGKDLVALPVIADDSHTTASATPGPSQEPVLRYEYGAGDNYPGAGIPALISPTEAVSTTAVYTPAQPTGNGPTLKYEYAEAENQRPGIYLSTVITKIYRPQPTQPPPVLEYEYVGAENPVANPFTSTTGTTTIHTATTTPPPGAWGVLSTATSFVTSYPATPTPTTLTTHGQQPEHRKPPALLYENVGRGVADTGVTLVPTGGSSLHVSGQHEKRRAQGSPEEIHPLLLREGYCQWCPFGSAQLGRHYQLGCGSPWKGERYFIESVVLTDIRYGEIFERGFVRADDVAIAHNPGDHG
ncbi:unnamed protein product [Tuber aestivum]|uniref:Uncharacterized protein n=1 Tax=Tuber aestivum TaxID=59557 RepID=A0A292Q1V6_9PEZI|nr:unnamed protein product [Tuber aestivum]